MIPAEVLLHLAARASTIEERLEPPFEPAAATDAERVDARITRWAQLGAKGDLDRLRRSLAWRGIDLDRIRPALADPARSPGMTLPGWVQRFAELLEATLVEHRRGVAGSPPADAAQAVMAPFARAAAAALRRAIAGHAGARVTEPVVAVLEARLLLRLARIASAVLAAEYHLYAHVDSRRGGAPETRAQRFAERMLEPSVPEFLVDHPVLARLLTLACDNWQAAAIELFARLSEDSQAIAEQFHDGRDSGQLVDIEIGDADVHDGHREVVILVFDDGFRIVYKPRSLVLDHVFHAFVGWLNERGLSPTLRSPAVLCRDGYGWAEFITHRPAADAAELELFYRRAGVLACVAYLMGATDLHGGNLIADGGHPIVVDLETMLRALPPSDVLPLAPAAAQTAQLGPERSVLHSLLLPLLQRVPTGAWADMSALGAGPKALGTIAEPHWLPIRDAPLAPILRDHGRVIEKGFAAAYRLIQRERSALLSESGPLTAFARCPVRAVLRDTALYFQLLRNSIDAAVLRDGADRAIALERLNHAIAIADEPSSFVGIVPRETAALAGLDVPRFLVMSDETDLRDAAGVVVDKAMERSPLAEMRLRIEAMGEPDLQRQLQDIRWALCGCIAGRDGLPRNLPAPGAAKSPAVATLTAAAERLGAALLDEAETWGGVPPPWRGLVYVTAAQRFTVGDAGASFADGGLGIAALFAALFRVTRNPHWRNAALRLSRRYLVPAADLPDYHGHVAGGIAAGMGGALYAVALIAALAESDEVLGQGVQLAQRLAGRAVTEEREPSLGAGLAGTLLGLSALRRLAPERGFDDICERGADRLRAAKPPAGGGLLSGRAGLALAARAIGLEGDFPVPDSLASESEMDWAEGAVGRSLAALRADRDAANAVDFFATLAAAPSPADDGFAFGSSGEADALLWVAERTGRTEFRSVASQRMAQTGVRAGQGTPRLLGGALGEGSRIPGLFHGSAGIAYVLLRLAAPDRLPALAAFELPD